MTTKRRVVVGSLVGAAAIHVVMLACSATDTTALNRRDGGGSDGGGSDGAADVASVDAPRGDDAHSVTDAGGFLDAFLDAVRDVVGAETRDAHAQDATTRTCDCPTPVPPPVPIYREQSDGVTTSGDRNWLTVPNTSVSVTVGEGGTIDLQASGGVRIDTGNSAVCGLRFVVDGEAPGVEGDAHVYLGAGVSFLTTWSALRRVSGLAAGPHTVSLQIARVPGFGTANCMMEGAGFTFRKARMLVTAR
ncbi:MAG: hypothetical protein JWM10_1296 [Myxococcaceae bacterium]|nr:hypothetical protein [Myxococcaceae bacterium]